MAVFVATNKFLRAGLGVVLVIGEWRASCWSYQNGCLPMDFSLQAFDAMRGISGLFWIVYDGDIQWWISWGDHRHVAVGAEYSILPRLDERQLGLDQC
jgi:hypothetical protein